MSPPDRPRGHAGRVLALALVASVASVAAVTAGERSLADGPSGVVRLRGAEATGPEDADPDATDPPLSTGAPVAAALGDPAPAVDRPRSDVVGSAADATGPGGPSMGAASPSTSTPSATSSPTDPLVGAGTTVVTTVGVEVGAVVAAHGAVDDVTRTAPPTSAPQAPAPAPAPPDPTPATPAPAPPTAPPSMATNVRGDVRTSEQRLLRDPGVLWVGTADEGDWQERWGVTGPGMVANTTRAVSPGGGRGWGISIENAGGGTLGDRWGYDGRFGFEASGFGPQEEAYLRYYVWFPADFEFDTQGKMPGLQGVLPGASPWLANSSVPCPSGPDAGKDCHDDRQFGARTMWKDGGMITYLNVVSVGLREHDDVRTADGNMYSFSIPYRDDAGEPLTLGAGWNLVEQRVRLNTPGRRDGIFEGWINGRLGVSLDDVQYRAGNRPDLRISQWNLSHFWGGPPTDYPEHPTRVIYDDIVVSRAPVGGRTG